jgi:hypothetical protein
MEFFNKKEEVLNVELTEYGEYMLAIGKLNPTFYAFFDDDIQYDTAGSGYSETQNDIANRIQYETPQLKILGSRSGADSRVERSLSAISGGVGNLSINSTTDEYIEIFRAQQEFTDGDKMATYPIGTSMLTTPYNASWQLEVLSVPEVTSATRTYEPAPNGNIENIPQVNITIDYETYFRDGEQTDAAISGYLGDQNIFVGLRENYLFLELFENNTVFEKENFEIEVYHSASGENGVGVLTQKQFFTDPDTAGFGTPDSSEVEYFMNVLVDGEIPQEVRDELNISDNVVNTNAGRIRLNRDLYQTDNEEPC